MSTRKRKPVPAFKLAKTQEGAEENDLKKVKEQLKKEFEAHPERDKDWFDKELEKNLKNIK